MLLTASKRKLSERITLNEIRVPKGARIGVKWVALTTVSLTLEVGKIVASGGTMLLAM